MARSDRGDRDACQPNDHPAEHVDDEGDVDPPGAALMSGTHVGTRANLRHDVGCRISAYWDEPCEVFGSGG